MTQPEATAFAAALTALIALTAAVIAAVVALINETKRRRDARHAEELKELRYWIGQVYTHLFAIQHETEWLTWHARFHPAAVTDTMVADYNVTTHAALPKALGAMAVVASLNTPVYDRLKASTDELYDLEGRVALAATSSPRNEAIAQLAGLNGQAQGFIQRLTQQLSEAMRNVNIEPKKQWGIRRWRTSPGA